MASPSKQGIKQTRDYLNDKFDDLKRPTGQDFADFIASYPNFLVEDLVASDGKLGINLGELATPDTDGEKQNLPNFRLDLEFGDITDPTTGSCEQARIGNMVVYDSGDTFNLGYNALINAGATPAVDDYAIRQNADGEAFISAIKQTGADSLFLSIRDQATGTDENKISIGEMVNIHSDLEVKEALAVIGTTALHDALKVKKDVTLDDILTVKGATTLEDTLQVDKKATLKDELEVQGATALKGTTTTTLVASGLTELNAGLEVTGLSSLEDLKTTSIDATTIEASGKVTLNDELEVKKTAIFKDVTIDNDVEVNGTTILEGLEATTIKATDKVTLDNDLEVKGDTKLKALEASTIKAKDEGTFEKDVKIDGDITLGGHLNFQNKARLTINTDDDLVINTNSSKSIILNDKFNAKSSGVIEVDLEVNNDLKVTNLLEVSTSTTLTTELNAGNKTPKVADFFGLVNIGNSTSATNTGTQTAPAYRPMLEVHGGALKPQGGMWDNLSDLRLKTDVESFTDGLSLLKKVNPVSYRYNGKAQTHESVSGIGIIAQEVKSIFPYMMRPLKRKLNPEDKEETEILGFNGSAFTYILINAVKELSEKVEQLEKQLSGNK